MEKKLAYDFLEALKTIKDAVKQMKEYYTAGNISSFNSISMDVWDGLFAIQQLAQQRYSTDSKVRLADACSCAMESLKDIKCYLFTAPQKVGWKLEYELESIIEVMTMQFYFWGIVDEYPEEREKFRQYLYETDIFELLRTPKEERKFEFDLTIMVTTYNHLDYAVQCIENIQKNMPQDIKCELILLNHGSTDETKQFFERNNSIKVINVAVNGIMPLVENKANMRGKYYLWISNDVIVGENTISNLYRCIREHPEYGLVVPATPNISNMQTIRADYSSYREFELFTHGNNIYDERRHEQRVRLCTPLHMIPSEVWVKMMYEMYEEQCCNKNNLSYSDDKYSLWMRRNRYKCILAKDAYCHHFGSVTLRHDLGKQLEQQRFYREGRAAFFRTFQVDPWGLGFCYDANLFEQWEIKAADNVVVLGINCGLGSNSLKIKECIHEKGGKGTVLYNATQEIQFLEDLKGISEKAFVFKEFEDIEKETGRKRYDYIVVEGTVLNKQGKTLEELLGDAGIQYGEAAFKASDTSWQFLKGSILMD